jgi:hypothetical protein
VAIDVSGGPASDPVPTVLPGRIVVNSVPWGTVYVDGSPVGNTPIQALSVSAGRHVIEVVRDGFTPHLETVLVEPGATVRVTRIRLERPES